MKPYCKTVFFAGIFLIRIGCLNAQICRIEKEWPAEDGLRNIVVSAQNQELVPAYFVYPFQAIPNDGKGSIPIRWTDPQDFLLSSGNGYLGVFLQGPAPTRDDEPQLYEFKVFDSNGGVIFNLSGMLPSITERPFYFLNEAGRSLTACSFWGDQLHFYDRQGQLLNERRFIQEGTLSLINPKGVYDDSGYYFLFNLSRAREEEEKIGPDLFMFSANGARLWQYQLPLKTTGAVALSRSGKIAAVCGTIVNPQPPQPVWQTILFDSLGNVLNSFPVAFRNYDFDLNDRWFLLGDNHQVNLISLVRKSIYLELTPGRGRRKIMDCALMKNERLLILTGLESAQGGETLYDDPEILIYSPEGELFFRQVFESDYNYNGQLILNNTRERFGLILQNRFVVYNFMP
jgi:hypothetical protein